MMTAVVKYVLTPIMVATLLLSIIMAMPLEDDKILRFDVKISGKLNSKDFMKVYIIPPNGNVSITVDVPALDVRNVSLAENNPINYSLNHREVIINDIRRKDEFGKISYWNETLGWFIADFRGARLLYFWTIPELAYVTEAIFHVKIHYSQYSNITIDTITYRILKRVVSNPSDITKFYNIKYRKPRVLIVTKDLFGATLLKVALSGKWDVRAMTIYGNAEEIRNIVWKYYNIWPFDMLILHGDYNEIPPFIIKTVLGKTPYTDWPYAITSSNIPQFLVTRVPLHYLNISNYLIIRQRIEFGDISLTNKTLYTTGLLFPPLDGLDFYIYGEGLSPLTIRRRDKIVLVAQDYDYNCSSGEYRLIFDNLTRNMLRNELKKNYSTLFFNLHGSSNAMYKLYLNKSNDIWGSYTIYYQPIIERKWLTRLSFTSKRAILFACDTLPEFGIDLLSNARVEFVIGFSAPVEESARIIVINYLNMVNDGLDDYTAIFTAYLLMPDTINITYNKLILHLMGIPSIDISLT